MTADDENESSLRCGQVNMLTVNMSPGLGVTSYIASCSMAALIHNSFLVNSSLYVSSPQRASLVLLPVQYSTVRYFYDTILLAGSMLYFHSPPLRVHINAILYRHGRSDSQSYPVQQISC